MSNHLETEFKLRATNTLETAAVDAAIRECGVQCRERHAVKHRDIYFDDANGSLQRQGIGLRIRSTGDRRELTFKSKQRGSGHLFVRTELNADWQHAKLPQAASELPTCIRVAVQPHIQDSPLVQQQELTVHREVRILYDDRHDLCELAIDSVRASASGRTVSFQEVELEVRNDLDANRELADRLKTRLPLAPATQDKPSHAASLLGIQPRMERSAEEAALEPARTAAPKVLSEQFAQLLQVGAQLTASSSQKRLAEASRHLIRMRATLRTFRGLWAPPTEARLARFWREANQRLRQVLEHSVLQPLLQTDLEHLPAELRAAGEEAIAWLADQRLQQMSSLLQWRDATESAAERLQFATDLQEVQTTKSPLADTHLLHAVRAELSRSAMRLRRRIRALPEDAAGDAGFHKLRLAQLATTRTNGLAQMFADLPDTPRAKTRRVLAKADRALSRACRHRAAASRLTTLALHREPPSDLFGWSAALGALATLQQRASIAEARHGMLALAKVDRKRTWRDLAAS